MKHSIETQRDWQKSLGFNPIKTTVYYKHDIIPINIEFVYTEIGEEDKEKFLTMTCDPDLEKALTDYFKKEKDFHQFAKQIFN